MSEAKSAAPTRWAREYETIYILRPNVDPDEAQRIATRVAEVIERLEGKLTKVDNWGRRKLAYPIQKQTRGIFVLVKYVAFGDMVAEVERNLRLFDAVIRYQTIANGGRIDPATVVVDPEETKFLPIEPVTEEEPELDAAQRLGLVPVEGESPRRRGGGEDEEGMDEIDEESADEGAAAAGDEEG